MQNLSPLEKADLRKYLGILDIRHNFKVLDWYFAARASVKIRGGEVPLTMGYRKIQTVSLLHLWWNRKCCLNLNKSR